LQVLEWENDLTPYEERSIVATFAKQFDQLKKESRDVSNLMKLLSFFDPENIPVEMIVNGAKVWLSQHPQSTIFPPIPNTTGSTQFQTNSHGPAEGIVDNVSHVSHEFRPLATLIVSSSRLKMAVQKLQNLSLVERRSNDGKSALWIHDLTQCMMQDGVQKEPNYREWLRLSVTLVCGAFRIVKATNLSRRWAECEKFMPHFRSLNHAWKDMREMNVELMEADRKIAGYLVSRGRYDDAEVLYQKAMDGSQTKFGPEHFQTLEAVGNLVWVFWLQGRYGEAEALAVKGLRGCENVMGVSHPMTLKMVEALADVHECQGRYVEAEMLFRRVLAGNPPKGLFVATKLANVCKHLKKYDEAEALLKKAEAVMEKQLGPDHLNTLKTVNDIAGLYQLRGEYPQAEELYKRVLWYNERQLGSENPDTLTARHNLAIIKVCQSQCEDGRRLLLDVLAGREKRLGFDHPVTLVTVYSLFEVCSELGRHADAETFLKRAAHGCRRRLDAHHHFRLMVEENLSNIHQSQAEMLCTSFTELWS
jgi:tetratricopeptide (TPR) repeat protein